MKKLKHILFITLWIGLSVGLLLSLGFVNKKQQAMPFGSIEVNVDQDEDLFFLDKIDIIRMLYDRGDSIVGSKRAKVNITAKLG